MKEYQKPEVETIKFTETEEMMNGTGAVEGSEGMEDVGDDFFG